MAVTQQDIDAAKAQVAALNQMLADGVRQVTLGEQTITYNTTDSLIKARNDAATRLAQLQTEFAGRRPQTRTYLYYAGRGVE